MAAHCHQHYFLLKSSYNNVLFFLFFLIKHLAVNYLTVTGEFTCNELHITGQIRLIHYNLRSQHILKLVLLDITVEQLHIVPFADEFSDHLLVQSGVFSKPLSHLTGVHWATQKTFFL